MIREMHSKGKSEVATLPSYQEDSILYSLQKGNALFNKFLAESLKHLMFFINTNDLDLFFYLKIINNYQIS